MWNLLFRPLRHLGLRALLFVIALVLFMSGGLQVATWLATPQGRDDWQLAILLLSVGGLLLFKARSPDQPSP
jgi:hypothetical protein